MSDNRFTESHRMSHVQSIFAIALAAAMLLAAGCDQENPYQAASQQEKNRLLMAAVSFAQVERVELLLDAGADPTITRDVGGRSYTLEDLARGGKILLEDAGENKEAAETTANLIEAGATVKRFDEVIALLDAARKKRD